MNKGVSMVSSRGINRLYYFNVIFFIALFHWNINRSYSIMIFWKALLFFSLTKIWIHQKDRCRFSFLEYEHLSLLCVNYMKINKILKFKLQEVSGNCYSKQYERFLKFFFHLKMCYIQYMLQKFFFIKWTFHCQ